MESENKYSLPGIRHPELKIMNYTLIQKYVTHWGITQHIPQILIFWQFCVGSNTFRILIYACWYGSWQVCPAVRPHLSYAGSGSWRGGLLRFGTIEPPGALLQFATYALLPHSCLLHNLLHLRSCHFLVLSRSVVKRCGQEVWSRGVSRGVVEHRSVVSGCLVIVLHVTVVYAWFCVMAKPSRAHSKENAVPYNCSVSVSGSQTHCLFTLLADKTGHECFIIWSSSMAWPCYSGPR